VILKDIAPWVEQNVKLDAQKRALWGHSYGGLFVLDSLLDGRYFSHFFAASPSLSWADGRMMQKIRTVKLVKEPQKHVWLMEGDLLTHAGAQQSANFDANGINKNREILSIFDRQGVESKF
jgi:predicted alpha/beta superfamily hydrolase